MAKATAGASPRGIYINLDRNPGRRQRMESELARLGLSGSYQRLAAADGTQLTSVGGRLSPGVLGCFMSHIKVLEIASTLRRPIHVLEDDVTPTRHAALFANMVAPGIFDQFDIIFTEMWIDADDRVVQALQAVRAEAMPPAGTAFTLDRLRLVNMAQLRVACTASYIVSPGGAARVLASLRAEAARGPTLAIDQFLNGEVQQGRLRAALLLPFLTFSNTDDAALSDIQKIDTDFTKVLLLLRNSFFVERDLPAIRGALADLRQRRPDDRVLDYVAAAIER
jgi:GR25 family glycosyltransferase involved in LPS biosynthesis